MAGLAAVSAPPLFAGSSPPPPPPPTLTPFTVRGMARSPLLKVSGRPPRPLRRSAPGTAQRCAAASGHGRREPRASGSQFDDDEPLWLAVVREIAASLRSLATFLAEQPEQLKHLEWPGFRNTLRTATLTLVLVAMFIVALSSVDAALCYILFWLLRKSA